MGDVSCAENVVNFTWNEIGGELWWNVL